MNLHVQKAHSFMKIIDDKNNIINHGKGKIVGTNFANKSFPLINYDTNDIVYIKDNQYCGCNDEGMIIDRIEGRIEDYIILPDNTRIGRLDHILKGVDNVLNAQIEQNNISEVVIRLVKLDGYTQKEESKIKSNIINRLGNEIKIYFQYVDHIPKEVNGKYRFIKQNIK